MKKIIFSVVGVVAIAAITSLIFFSNGCSKDTKIASNDEESSSISLRSANVNSATIQ